MKPLVSAADLPHTPDPVAAWIASRVKGGTSGGPIVTDAGERIADRTVPEQCVDITWC
jgi:hypothetical protein